MIKGKRSFGVENTQPRPVNNAHHNSIKLDIIPEPVEPFTHQIIAFMIVDGGWGEIIATALTLVFLAGILGYGLWH
jgi:hypothetical protein